MPSFTTALPLQSYLQSTARTSWCVVPRHPSPCSEEVTDALAVILSHLHQHGGYAITVASVSSDVDPCSNVSVLLSICTLGVDLWH